jgi:hypothetical protein
MWDLEVIKRMNARTTEARKAFEALLLQSLELLQSCLSPELFKQVETEIRKEVGDV